MKKLFIFTLYILLGSLTFNADLAFAEQKYNSHTGEWETTSPDSQLQYNPYQKNWSYEEPGATIEYNPHNGQWEYPK